jgi:hypothetical protein
MKLVLGTEVSLGSLNTRVHLRVARLAAILVSATRDEFGQGRRTRIRSGSAPFAKPLEVFVRQDQAAVEALALTPLRNARLLSLVFAAFSSFRLVVRNRTISS